MVLKIIAVVLFLGMAVFGLSVVQRLSDFSRHQGQVGHDLARLQSTAPEIAWEADDQALTIALVSPPMQALRDADPARYREAKSAVEQVLQSLGYQSRGRWTALRSGLLVILLGAGAVWSWRRGGRAALEGARAV